MSLHLSSVAQSERTGRGEHFSVHRLDLETLGGLGAPIMGFDHYRMSGPTFPPHPHAGFSAVSYVFEDSQGGLRNRDSLRHDSVIEPGGLVWSQAASGMVHEEFPAQPGREVHGVQIFINLSRRNKTLAPRMWEVAAADVPVVLDGSGNRTRVLTGDYAGARSAVVTAEPVDVFDVGIEGTWTYNVPARRNVLIYVLRGAIEVRAGSATRRVEKFQAVAGRTDDADELTIIALAPSQILVLSGTDPAEPVAVHGPFIMNDETQLEAAFDRFRRGEMGHLAPLDHV